MHFWVQLVDYAVLYEPLHNITLLSVRLLGKSSCIQQYSAVRSKSRLTVPSAFNCSSEISGDGVTFMQLDFISRFGHY